MEILFYVGLYLIGVLAALYLIPRLSNLHGHHDDVQIFFVSALWPLSLTFGLAVLTLGLCMQMLLFGASHITGAGQAHKERKRNQGRQAAGW